MFYVSQTLNFNGKYCDTFIYKTLGKSWILKTLRKESIFLYPKRQFFSTYRGVYVLRCGKFSGYFEWLYTDIFKKDNSLRFFFSFSLHGSNVKSENVNEKTSLFCVTFLTVQVK